MATELVVTPGGYRPSDMVHKIGADLRLRILTGRLQGVDASDEPVADYGSVPRDGANPAMTPGYALPPGADTPEGSEPVTPLGPWLDSVCALDQRGQRARLLVPLHMDSAAGTGHPVGADDLSVPGHARHDSDDALASPAVGSLGGRWGRVLVGRELVRGWNDRRRVPR